MYQSHILAHDQLVPLARGPVGMALSVLAGLGATTLRGREHFQLLLCEVVEVAQVLVDLERLLNLLLLGLLFLLLFLLLLAQHELPDLLLLHDDTNAAAIDSLMRFLVVSISGALDPQGSDLHLLRLRHHNRLVLEDRAVVDHLEDLEISVGRLVGIVVTVDGASLVLAGAINDLPLRLRPSEVHAYGVPGVDLP